jgi:hypothetical protein
LISYARLFKRPLLFRSFTGLTVSEFDSIFIGIESKYNEHERRRRLSNRKKRQRDVGAGRPFKLKAKERFLMLLVYYRLYITFTLSGFLFDLDQSNVCRDISILEPLVKECIPLPKKLYKRTRRRARTMDEVEENFPGFKAFIDATEQEIPRPTKNKSKKMTTTTFYSGKKKKHTIKTQYMVNNEGLILHKTGHKSGRKHDYDIYKHNHPITPVQVENVFDLGYMGVQNDFPTVKSVLPVKKKRNSILSNEERTYNRKHSQLRIIVEHAICRIKKFGIMGTKFRNRLGRYDHVSDIVSGLVNFRIMMRTNRMVLL